MAARSADDKFKAAVKVIQSLPKNGSFQPSNDLMLKFYAYYKQATLGPCTTAKPSFWDVVGKAKWDAWNKLGTMPKEEAMLSYVEELKKVLDNVLHMRVIKNYAMNVINFYMRRLQSPPIMQVQFGWKVDRQRIVEAMPHTTMVADFVQTLGSFYELVDDKLVPNGGTHKENGMAAIENTPAEATTVKKMLPVPESDLSSDTGSADVSSESSPVHTTPPIVPVSDDNQVVMATIPTKAIPDTDWSTVATPPKIPLTNGDRDSHLDSDHGSHNGDVDSAGVNGDVESEAQTDSEAEEEFCDTSDLPQQLLLSVSQSSTPEPAIPKQNHIVTEATIHYSTEESLNSVPSSDALRSPHSKAPQLATTTVVSRGGGDTNGDGHGKPPGASSDSGNFSQQPRGDSFLTPSTPGQSSLLVAGGGGGGSQNPGMGGSRAEVSEQIALALVRLQQDMNSVLARLNTLEALSVAQHQLQRSRHNSEAERSSRKDVWWWPFGNLSGRTVFLLLGWPVIVHMVLSTLRKRRFRRK